MAKWEELPMADRAAYMRIAVKNGYRDIRSIKEVYNKYAEGGPKRVHNNTSPTAELSTKLEDVVATKIRNDKRINHAYDIPYIKDKETKIIGYTVPTNALDSIAKYAGKTNFNLEEAVALSFESGYGRQPYFNYGTKNISDRAIGNMNYFKNYGSIPSHLFVRDYEYTKGGYNKDKPYTDQAPLEHAINFFRSGRYNTKLRAVDPETGKTINHTQKVKLEAKKLLKDPNYQKWKKQSGLDEYTGKAQKARDRQKAINAENARKAKYREEHPIKAYFKDVLGIKYDDGGRINIETSEYNPVRLPEATVIAKPKKYNHFLSTLPKNLADSDETIYRMHRYWELNGMPKDFKEAKEKGLFELQEDGEYHAFSVAYDSANDRYEFMKYPNHPKINKELDWYNNTNEGKSFQQKYHLNTIGTPYYTYERNRDAYGNPVVNWNPPGQSFPEFISDKIMMTANKLFTDAIYNEVEDPYDPGYREGIIQRSFLLPRNLQKDAILKSGHYIEGAPKDYGLVKTAVGDRDIPVYQRAKDAITRDRLVPIANPMVKNDMEDDNNYLPYELSLINAAPYPTAIYYDPSTLNTPDGIKFYQKAWDLNDYGGEGGFTSEILYGIPGLIADWVGSPVVQTTGFQPISMEHNPDIISRFLNPHMEKHSMYPYIDETTGHTYYKKGTKPITQEEEEEEDYLPVLTEQELNDHYKELGFDISPKPKNKRKRP